MSPVTRRTVLATAAAAPLASSPPALPSGWDECDAIAQASPPRVRSTMRLIAALGRRSGLTPEAFLTPLIAGLEANVAERRS